MKKILFCAHSNYEYFLCVSILSLLLSKDKKVSGEIICPPQVTSGLPSDWCQLFDKVHSIDLPRVSFAIHSDVRIARKFYKFLEDLTIKPDVVFCVAWRSTANNMLAKKYSPKVRMVSAINGIDADPSLYTSKPLLKTAYRFLFDAYFGHSHIEVTYQKGDKNHAYSNWKNDPMNCVIQFIENEKQQITQTRNKKSLPIPVTRIEGKKNDGKKKLLFIGERTPLFEDITQEQDQLVQKVIDTIRSKFDGWELLFRPRTGYTEIEKLNLEGFEIISADTPLEYELYHIKPEYVISAKSTISKFSWSINIPSAVFYPALALSSHHMEMLDKFFADTPTLPRITTMHDLSPQNVRGPDAQLQVNAADYYSAIFDEIS
jgi:hypothetical protein